MTKTLAILGFAAFLAYIGWSTLGAFEAATANHAAQIEEIISGR